MYIRLINACKSSYLALYIPYNHKEKNIVIKIATADKGKRKLDTEDRPGAVTRQEAKRRAENANVVAPKAEPPTPNVVVWAYDHFKTSGDVELPIHEDVLMEKTPSPFYEIALKRTPSPN